MYLGVANAEVQVNRGSPSGLLRPQFVTQKRAEKTLPPLASHVHEVRLVYTDPAGGCHGALPPEPVRRVPSTYFGQSGGEL